MNIAAFVQDVTKLATALVFWLGLILLLFKLKDSIRDTLRDWRDSRDAKKARAEALKREQTERTAALILERMKLYPRGSVFSTEDLAELGSDVPAALTSLEDRDRVERSGSGWKLPPKDPPPWR